MLSTSYKAVYVPKEMCFLMTLTDPHFLSSLAAIKLYEGSPVLPIEARMLSFTELIEFSNHIPEVLTVVVSKHHGKLSLHLLEIY